MIKRKGKSCVLYSQESTEQLAKGTLEYITRREKQIPYFKKLNAYDMNKTSELEKADSKESLTTFDVSSSDVMNTTGEDIYGIGRISEEKAIETDYDSLELFKAKGTTHELEAKIEEFLINDVTYKNESVFDLYQEDIRPFFHKKLEIGTLFGPTGLPVYLGYRVKRDEFIIGYNLKEENQWKPTAIIFKVLEYSIEVIDVNADSASEGQKVYFFDVKGLYKKLKKEYRDLVDLIKDID